jgi:hypothetical protein
MRLRLGNAFGHANAPNKAVELAHVGDLDFRDQIPHAVRYVHSGEARVLAQGEHEVLWGRLVTGRLYKVSGQTKPGCETASFAKTRPIRTQG